ncbi:helix-turn-helix domain-containing protein [Bacillus haynesii]|uniref:helix-turn-helix domain-containing protein n=1 Tax=Bacillus haynesii TaxID=1925021 RepID=UPI00227F308D|nr:helix-turn-helix domain-containing protein [Bacillus haynesii]MCY8609862.1 helix-turn-helix domain-containing protein [Bacillus haynesii]
MHYLAEHQTFDSTAELNAAVYEHIKRNTFSLTPTQKTTFKTIARYAVKFPGVAHLKAETLASLIGKSVKTVRRALNQLEELEIIKKIPTTRKVNGGRGANIFVILPVKQQAEISNDQSIMSTRGDHEKQDGTSSPGTKTKNEPSNSIKQFKKQKHYQDTEIPAAALRNSIPEAIFSAMSRYFEADNIYKYYGVLLRAKASVDNSIILEHHSEEFVNVWHAAILKTKQGCVRNLKNYLYVGFRQAAIEIKRRLNQNKSLIQKFRDFLED